MSISAEVLDTPYERPSNLTEKDKRRLAKEPFKTLAEITLPETQDALRGWREPSGAYILFEKINYHTVSEGEYRKGSGLMTLNVENRPEQSAKLDQYVIGKRFRIIHFGNFPRLDDAKPERASKARLYSGKNGRNPWDILRAKVVEYMNLNPNWRDEKAALLAQNDILEAKRLAAEKALAELKKASK